MRVWITHPCFTDTISFNKTCFFFIQYSVKVAVYNWNIYLSPIFICLYFLLSFLSFCNLRVLPHVCLGVGITGQKSRENPPQGGGQNRWQSVNVFFFLIPCYYPRMPITTATWLHFMCLPRLLPRFIPPSVVLYLPFINSGGTPIKCGISFNFPFIVNDFLVTGAVFFLNC